MANVIITGTSSGFGRLAAETLAGAGHTVFATMRNSAGSNAQAAAELKAFGAADGGRVHVVDLDVTRESSVHQAVDAIAKQTGGVIDVLFNNAGRFSAGVQEAYSLEEVQSLFDTNVFSVLRMNRAVLPYMRKRHAGLIITMSSIVGRFALPCVGVYAASKFALEALTDAQRDELRSLGIDVVLLQPGAHPTRVSDNGLYAADRARADEYGDVAAIPQKMGEGLAQLFSSPVSPRPQDVADTVKKLIETPAGQRPERVVVDTLTGDPVRALNDEHLKQRRALLVAFGMAS
jgi:NAD(P)-dependent dehydrogenase (short-subunit alcohol dehydrogenase family)